MSTTSIPAARVYACTMGSSEYVASIGASSVYVYTIFCVGSSMRTWRYSSSGEPSAKSIWPTSYLERMRSFVPRGSR